MSFLMALGLTILIKGTSLVAAGFLLGLGFWSCKQLTSYVEEKVITYRLSRSLQQISRV